MKVSNSEKRLKELLEILNITQLELSEKTGIDPSTISLYCSGKRVPRQDKISAICDVFNVNPAWLLGYDVPMRNEKHDDFKKMFYSAEYDLDGFIQELSASIKEMNQNQLKRILEYAKFIKERT